MTAWVPLLMAGSVLALPAARLGTAGRLAGVPAARAGMGRAGMRRTGMARVLSGALSPLDTGGPTETVRRDAAVALIAGSLVAMVVGGVPGIGAGAAATAACMWALGRWGHPDTADDPLAVAALLDLFAACLRGGLPVAYAVASAAGGTEARARPRVVDRGGERAQTRAAALGAPKAAQALHEVADLLVLGGENRAAWSALEAQPGLEPLARMAVRGADSGASLAAGAEELAESFRRSAADDAVAAAEKAQITIAGPLGVCFLPAFVCLGIAPVIVGLAGKILGGPLVG